MVWCGDQLQRHLVQKMGKTCFLKESRRRRRRQNRRQEILLPVKEAQKKSAIKNRSNVCNGKSRLKTNVPTGTDTREIDQLTDGGCRCRSFARVPAIHTHTNLKTFVWNIWFLEHTWNIGGPAV